MAYLLDANVFIEAKKRFYGLDFSPAYWEWLIVGLGIKCLTPFEMLRIERARFVLDSRT